MLTDIIREILFPRRCIACRTREATGAICDACHASIVINQTLFCGACRARLPEGKKTCHKNFPYLLGAATDYENPVARELIRALKFRRIRDAADPLADALATYVTRLPIDFQSLPLLPVPLSKRRERERGFNQSDLIAQELATRYDFALAESILVRTKHTKPQSETENIADRRENLHGAFTVHAGPSTGSTNSPQASSGQVPNIPPRILLLDDVTTSGATFLAAATALKAAGVRQIIALAVAKA